VAEASVLVSDDAGVDSELEIAVSASGRNIVIGSNGDYYYSDDAGQTWTLSTSAGADFNGNDPSVAWGQSGGALGTFYAANIGSATPPGLDATDIRISTDGGQTFNPQGFAYTCPPNAPDAPCPAGFPDQEHIAADRFNVTATGDQVYSAWRHLEYERPIHQWRLPQDYGGPGRFRLCGVSGQHKYHAFEVQLL
jgi:hypothetical protein